VTYFFRITLTKYAKKKNNNTKIPTGATEVKISTINPKKTARKKPPFPSFSSTIL
jgi:hypothetical protein